MAERGRQRQALKASMGLNEDQSILHEVKVKPRTRQDYRLTLKAFVEWWDQPLPTTESGWDDALQEYLEKIYLEGAPLADGKKALSAIQWQYPKQTRKGKKNNMILSRESLKGWHQLEPPRSRLPLPEGVVFDVALYLFNMGLLEICLVVLLTMECYFRPAEPHKLLARHVVDPSQVELPPGKFGPVHLAITLHAQEEGDPSKTKEFDESILLDLPHQAPLANAFLNLKKQRHPDHPLFGATYRDPSILDQLPGPVELPKTSF